MYRSTSLYLKALGLTAVIGLASASPTVAQRSGVEIWGATCGRCHVIQPPSRYDVKAWADIGLHMGITARLTSAETDAVIAFLQSGARQPGATMVVEDAGIAEFASLVMVPVTTEDPANIFKKQCAACHGKEGRGDGMAAVAFNPKPVDFLSPEFAQVSEDAILRSIADGKGGMPAFATLLEPADISAVAEYLLELSSSERNRIASGTDDPSR